MASSTLEICAPSRSDAARIADIHLAAMGSNPLLHIQFPTPDSLARLRDYLEAYTVKELDDRTKGVLVARLIDTDEIISFAKWDCPSYCADATNVKLETGDIKDIEGCNPLYLERYAATAAMAKERFFGDGRCYSFSFVCTDPKYQGLGAGSMLTQEVIKRASAENMPVYLESTKVAVKMYEKLGFSKVGELRMRIPGQGKDKDIDEVYEETCMIRRPLSSWTGHTHLDVPGCFGWLFPDQLQEKLNDLPTDLLG